MVTDNNIVALNKIYHLTKGEKDEVTLLSVFFFFFQKYIIYNLCMSQSDLWPSQRISRLVEVVAHHY